MRLIITVIFGAVKTLINLVLLPLNAIVEGLLPSVSDALTSLTSLLDWLKDFTAWVISWLPFSSTFYAFVVGALVFIYAVPVTVSAVKLIVKWWHSLVP